MPEPCPDRRPSAAPPGAVIFDLDDTLVHGWDAQRARPVDVHYLAWRTALAARGIRIERDRYLAHMKGLDNAGCNAYLEHAFAIPASEQIAAVKERCYREQVAPRYLRLRPGAIPCLEGLVDAGVGLGILTNAPRANLEASYRVVPLARWIPPAQALSADDLGELGLPVKPAGEGLCWLGERLGAGRESLVYVGDSRIDVRAGRAAGVAVVGLAVNYPAAELRALGAGDTVADLAELDPARLAALLRER